MRVAACFHAAALAAAAVPAAEATESAAAEHGLQLVVLLATFRVTDDVVGLGRLLEAVLGSFVTGVLVRVVLPGELPVGLLDVLGGGG